MAWQVPDLVPTGHDSLVGAGAPRGHLCHRSSAFERNPSQERIRKTIRTWDCVVEPPIGIEPMTYALREARSLAAHALAAPISRETAQMALTALGLSPDPVHEPVHARGFFVTPSCSLCAARHASFGMTLRHEQPAAG